MKMFFLRNLSIDLPSNVWWCNCFHSLWNRINCHQYTFFWEWQGKWANKIDTQSIKNFRCHNFKCVHECLWKEKTNKTQILEFELWQCHIMLLAFFWGTHLLKRLSAPILNKYESSQTYWFTFWKNFFSVVNWNHQVLNQLLYNQICQ